MISAQTRSAFVARENRFTLFRIMLLGERADMNNVVRFVPKSELERERLIREARAIYDSIFPPVATTNEQADSRPEKRTQTHASAFRD